LFRAPLEAAPAGEGLFVRPAVAEDKFVAFGLTVDVVGTGIDLITGLFDLAGMGAGMAGESLSVFSVGPRVGPSFRDGRVADGTEVGPPLTGVATGTAFKGAATFFSLVGDVFCLTALAVGFSSFFLGSGINGVFAFGGGFVVVLLVFFIFDP
jgi:hypothetical protein